MSALTWFEAVDLDLGDVDAGGDGHPDGALRDFLAAVAHDDGVVSRRRRAVVHSVGGVFVVSHLDRDVLTLVVLQHNLHVT
jgi:1,6-anhydro-N-acetylmuramate kinase